MPLVHAKTELRTVFENIHDGVLFLDNRGTIIVMNRALQEMLSLREDITGTCVFSLPMKHSLREGIFRTDREFGGLSCWERNNCLTHKDCPVKKSNCCRCWVFQCCGTHARSNRSCINCAQYKSVRPYLEKPKELAIGEKIISVLSSFIEYGDKEEIWEVIVFRDVTYEKLDAVCKLAGATAHELRQPLQVILNCLAILNTKLSGSRTAEVELDAIKDNVRRMDIIIEKINHLTRYKTKPYIMNERILDIEESTDRSEAGH